MSNLGKLILKIRVDSQIEKTPPTRGKRLITTSPITRIFGFLSLTCEPLVP